VKRRIGPRKESPYSITQREARAAARLVRLAAEAQRVAERTWRLVGADPEAVALLCQVVQGWPSHGVVALREEIDITNSTCM
jgi:hypothetical protein